MSHTQGENFTQADCSNIPQSHWRQISPMCTHTSGNFTLLDHTSYTKLVRNIL